MQEWSAAWHDPRLHTAIQSSAGIPAFFWRRKLGHSNSNSGDRLPRRTTHPISCSHSADSNPDKAICSLQRSGGADWCWSPLHEYCKTRRFTFFWRQCVSTRNLLSCSLLFWVQEIPSWNRVYPAKTQEEMLRHLFRCFKSKDKPSCFITADDIVSQTFLKIWYESGRLSFSLWGFTFSFLISLSAYEQVTCFYILS